MNKILKKIICFAIIISCIFMSYSLLKDYHDKKEYRLNVVENRKCCDPGSALRVALEQKNWDNVLGLSENFKSKYKNKYDIIPNAKIYKQFSYGYDYDGEKELISISSDVPESIFDLYGVNTVTTIFDFEYNVNENNELDDIKLVKTYKINTMTAKPIEE